MTVVAKKFLSRSYRAINCRHYPEGYIYTRQNSRVSLDVRLVLLYVFTQPGHIEYMDIPALGCWEFHYIGWIQFVLLGFFGARPCVTHRRPGVEKYVDS